MSVLTRPPEARKSKPGCLFYGCLIVVILAVLIGAAVGLAGWYGVKKFREAVDLYTSTTPVVLPPVTMPDSEFTALEEQVATFGTALDEGRAREPLTLTAEELNALIERSEAMKAWKGTIRVMMDNDQLRGQVSLPLSAAADMPLLSGLRGRYLNGAARLRVGMEGGRLAVRLQGMEVNGQQIPAEILRGLQEINLAEGAYENRQTADTLSRISRIEVKDGRLVIVPSGSGAP